MFLLYPGGDLDYSQDILESKLAQDTSSHFFMNEDPISSICVIVLTKKQTYGQEFNTSLAEVSILLPLRRSCKREIPVFLWAKSIYKLHLCQCIFQSKEIYFITHECDTDKDFVLNLYQVIPRAVQHQIFIQESLPTKDER